MDHHHYQQMQHHQQTSAAHNMGLLDDQQNQYSMWSQEAQQHMYGNSNEYEPHHHNQQRQNHQLPQSNQIYYSDVMTLGGVGNINQQHPHNLVQQQQQQHHHHQQQQQQSQQQMLMMPPPQKSPHVTSPHNYVGQSPHTYGENGTTSDDSDDSGLQRTNSLKRPSPEPLGDKMTVASNAKQLKGSTTPTTAPIKKPKVQRKKKKKDPNEPQKPVSAYALFFRDTQAAIKGQNPNASFGEVSTIVASMWDVLAPEHKDVYKKKTEAAKIVYLKTLAAYRASVISKGSDVESSPPPNQHASPPLHQQQQQQHQQTSTTMPPQQPIQSSQPTSSTSMSNASAANIPQQQQMSPLQHQVLPMQQQSNQYIHQQHHQVHSTYPQQQQQQYVSSYKSPEYNAHQVSMQPDIQAQQQLQQMGVQPHGGGGGGINQTAHLNYSAYEQQQPQHNLNGMVPNIDNNGYSHHNIQMQNSNSHQQQQTHIGGTGSGEHPADVHSSHQQQQQLQHQLPIHSQPLTNSLPTSGMNTSPPNVYPPNGQNVQQCIRNGCTNQAMVSPDWEDEYCSNECVINHCGDVFGNWIQKNGQQQQTYSAVK